MQFLSRLVLAAALLVATLSAQAALQARPGGMVYDTVQNITWLQNWNTNGLMNWATANTWANNLVHGGFDDWRLPTTNTTASSNCDRSQSAGGGFPQEYLGFNCTGSEMGHMFYNEFGASREQSIRAGSNTANLALFTNVQSFVYWSSTGYAPSSGSAWDFHTHNGWQGAGDVNGAVYAVAVRPGDVPAIPEPQTYALLLAGLGAVVVAVRRRWRWRPR